MTTQPTVEFLNKWAHEFLGNCWHSPKRNIHVEWYDCEKCGEPCQRDMRLQDGTNYCSDRNLSRKVVEKMPEDKWGIYLYQLELSADLPDGKKYYWYQFKKVIATAEQEVRAAYATMEEK